MLDIQLLKSVLSLKQRRYKHLNTIRINKSALVHNYQEISRIHPESKIAPVLKSNAYGHGLKLVAPILDELHPPFFIVDSLYEAYELYKIGVKTRILIIGYTNPENFSFKKLPFDFAVSDIETARHLNAHQPGCNIHIFVDTGLHREGVLANEFEAFISELVSLKNLTITGLCSHLADTDNSKTTGIQIDQFKKALTVLKRFNIHPQWRHIVASGGLSKIFDKTFNLIRPGIALYGIDSHIKTLEPVLSFSTTVDQVKKLQKGERVGYESTFEAKKSMTVALLPAGYYEGVDRRLSNKGFVSVGRVECPIVGRVSMNLTVVDVSEVPNVKIGDECVIYSHDPKNKNSIESAAKYAETIPYELLVHLAESVKRIVEK